MRILLTGGSGFVGAAVANQLCREGHEVIIYDVRVPDLQTGDTKYIKGDVFDVGHLTDVIKDCEVIIHLVGLADARTAQEHPQMSFDLNVGSLQVLVEAMRRNGIKKLILPSSAAVYGPVDLSPVSEEQEPNPANVYAYHKYLEERLAECFSRNYGIEVIVLRLFNVYGVRGKGILNTLIDKGLSNETVELYGEKQKRDFIHISDVASAFAGIVEVDLDNKFEIYNVGTGMGRSIEEIVALVKEYFPRLETITRPPKGILYDSVANIGKIKAVIDFCPEQSDTKIRELVIAYKEAMI